MNLEKSESFTKILMDHLGKNDCNDHCDKRNPVSEGLAHEVSERNMGCVEIGLDSIYVTSWLKISLYYVCVSKI